MNKRLWSLAFSAALATGAAQAGAVPLTTVSDLFDTSGGNGTAFVSSKPFTLASNAWASGSLVTLAPAGEQPLVDIQSVQLTRVGGGLDWSETISVDWNVAYDGVERWSMPIQFMQAGEWLLQVSGVTYAVKNENGFEASLELPEPQSAALAVLALLGAAGARLRRRVF